MTVEEMAARTADVIEECGWTQGTSVRRGRVCLVQAMQRASTGPAWSQLAARVIPLVGMSLVVWNDAPGRTVEEVVALLRGIAGTPAAVTDPAHVHALEG